MKEDTANYDYAIATEVAESQFSSRPIALSRSARSMTKAQFLRKYSDREDGNKYEFNQGTVEKTKGMNQLQANIYFILLRAFMKTEAGKTGGGMISEIDMDTSNSQLRRPDVAFFTAEQCQKMKSGENQVAPWLAEIISSTDNVNRINQKLEEYFQAGVQVVWHIFPDSKQVYVYTSPEKVVICRGETICSGAPALPDLEIAANLLF